MSPSYPDEVRKKKVGRLTELGVTVGGMLVKPEAVIRVVLVKPEAVTRADYRNWDQTVCAKIWARSFIFKSDEVLRYASW